MFAAALPVAIPILLAAVNMEPSTSPMVHAGMMVPAPRYEEFSPAEPATLPQHSVMLTIEEDDTLDSVLLAGGLTRKESADLTAQFGRSVDVRRLRPGHVLRFHHDENGSVDAVRMRVNGWGSIDAQRNGEGAFVVTPHEAHQTSVQTAVAAVIDSSLYEALRGAGEQPQLVQQLVDVFQWDIDFFSLQKGDSFSLIVEKKFSGAELTGYGAILAARFEHDGDVYEAFRHQNSDGSAGYYSHTGTPLRKQFLRAPLKFTRITSGFSKHRYHPLLHYFRPHNGVDYGAPVGTPVMTTADGVVAEVGYRGGEGKFIRIRHTSRIDTMYLHLSRYAKDIKRGARVTQGDVIGYVGMTGLATGPHLDYRVCDNGTWLDPLKLKSITPDPLKGDSLTRFRNNVAILGPRLSAATPQIAQAARRRRALF